MLSSMCTAESARNVQQSHKPMAQYVFLARELFGSPRNGAQRVLPKIHPRSGTPWTSCARSCEHVLAVKTPSGAPCPGLERSWHGAGTELRAHWSLGRRRGRPRRSWSWAWARPMLAEIVGERYFAFAEWCVSNDLVHKRACTTVAARTLVAELIRPRSLSGQTAESAAGWVASLS